MSSNASGNSRAFRGLFLVFALSLLNLVGLLFTVTAIGGLEKWSRWQFIGLFGLMETAGGLATIIMPNLWHLPVAEQQIEGKRQVKLAVSTLIIPHWGGAARAIAGLLLLVLAAWKEGFGAASAGLLPLILFLSGMMLCLSAVVARLGVAWPHLDVVQIVINWNRKAQSLRPISMGASLVQFLLSVATIPAVQLLSPGSLYQPELGPSPTALLATALGALALAFLVFALWWPRVDWRAPPAQQREVEENA